MKEKGLFGFWTDKYEKLFVSFDNPNPSALGMCYIRTLHAYLHMHNNELSSLRGLANDIPVRQIPTKSIDHSNLYLMEWLMSPSILDKNGSMSPLYSGQNFVGDSMWCQWIYLMNLETRKLEIHRGGNKNSKAPGRYSAVQIEGSDYCGPRLVAELSLNRIKAGNVVQLKKFMGSLVYDTDKGKDILKSKVQKQKGFIQKWGLYKLVRLNHL